MLNVYDSKHMEAPRMHRLSLFVATLALWSCAVEPAHKIPSNQAVADYVTVAQLEEIDSIRKGNSDSWQYLNPRYVIYRGSRDSYLIAFRDECAETSNNTWIPADYIHDHRNFRAGEDTIRGCIIEKIYELSKAQRHELRQIGGTPR